MGKVFYVGMQEHFDDREEIRHYLRRDQEFNTLGCLTYRACLTREIGIAPYHIWNDSGSARKVTFKESLEIL